MLDDPPLVFITSLVIMAAATWLGTWAGDRRRRRVARERDDYTIVLGATLTLLGLIIGFTFSMAVHRFEQRRGHEALEASAIGTALLRADLLSAADAATLKKVIREYARLRIGFYTADGESDLAANAARTAELQAAAWNIAAEAARAQPSMPVALVIEAINDMVDIKGNTQAAWWDRLPAAACVMMLLMAVCSTAMVGYVARDGRREHALLLVLPLVLAITFGLIADIDSPRTGFMRIEPKNLQALALPAD